MKWLSQRDSIDPWYGLASATVGGEEQPGTFMEEVHVKWAGAHTIIGCAIALSMLSCTWVPLTEEGQNVRVLQANATAGCKKVGEIGSKTADRVVIFARSDRKVREELEFLARNEASDLGGDAIVPIGTPTTNGRQSFDVYRCELP
jgi:hypothetical protein